MSDSPNQKLTRRHVLQGAAAVAVGSLLPKTAFAQSNSQPQPTLGTYYGSPVLVTFGTSHLGTIPKQFVGISTDKKNVVQYNLFTSTDTDYVGLFNQLSGPTGSIFRIGGNTQDSLTYGADFHYTDIQRLAAFLTATTNWQCIYGINLRGQGLANTVPGYTTTALAISEYGEVQTALGEPTPTLLVGITLGNEPENYPTTGVQSPMQYPASTWGTSPYETIWNSYYQAIFQSGARIKPTMVGGDTSAGSWAQSFGDNTQSQSPKVPLALLSNHFYIEEADSTPTPTVAALANWSNSYQGSTHHPSVNDFLYQDSNLVADLQSVTTTYGVPWRLTETNSYSGGGVTNVSDAFVSALWAIDYLFAVAQAGGSGVNFHTGGTSAYSPIFDNLNVAGITNPTPTIVNPLYYGMRFFNMGLDLTSSTNYSLHATTNGFQVGYSSLNGSIATIYCVQQSSTSATLMMTNKSNVNYFEVQTKVPWVCTQATIQIMTVTDPVNTGLSTLNYTGNPNIANPTYVRNTLIGGASINLDGSLTATPASNTVTIANNGDGTSTITCWLPIVSAALVTLTF